MTQTLSQIDLTRFGWAPGTYSCKCNDCQQHHVADKRASRCRECAIARMALTHADAYERGQRDMAAAAVKEIEPIGPTPSCCEECARRWHVLREKADALRALSTSPKENKNGS